MKKRKPVKRASLAKKPGAKYKSLIEYFRATGQIQNIERAQLYRAKHLFVTKNWTVEKIAKSLELSPSIIQRWVILFQWEEEKTKRLTELVVKANLFATKRGAGLDERHDRLLGTIESIAEQMLQRHQDGEDQLSPSDLQRLATTIRGSMDGRRTIHQKENPVKRTILQIEAPETFKNVAAAIVTASEHLNGTKSEEKYIPGQVLALPGGRDPLSGITHDTEYEEVEEEI